MARMRLPLAFATLLASAGAFGHPGHPATAVHLHAGEFAGLALLAILVAAATAAAIRAVATHKRKSRP